jgi:PTH1 family peptidyl-tRNA hydrolase
MKLIIGLGNPGKEYEYTRHNAGFMALDALADAVSPEHSAGGWKKEKNALVAKQGDIILAKPQTFMNLSGTAVQALMSFYKIPLENIIVIHDDIDLKLGDLREKVGGGSAGHNGIKSIDSAVGKDYRRIRIGVGRPEVRAESGERRAEVDPSDWVLGKFSESERKEITAVIEKIIAEFV